MTLRHTGKHSGRQKHRSHTHNYIYSGKETFGQTEKQARPTYSERLAGPCSKTEPGSKLYLSDSDAKSETEIEKEKETETD